MPVGFWNDPAGTRYHQAYFNMYPHVWRHGDWVTVTGRGGMIMHGRSDSTLNRHGVRLGSAEIYEALQSVPQILDALIVGVDEPGGGYWMPLFVVLAGGGHCGHPAEEHGQEGDPEPRIAASCARRHHRGSCPPPHPQRQGLEVPVKRLLQGADPAAVVDPGAVDNPDALAVFTRLGARRRTQKDMDP